LKRVYRVSLVLKIQRTRLSIWHFENVLEIRRKLEVCMGLSLVFKVQIARLVSCGMFILLSLVLKIHSARLAI